MSESNIFRPATEAERQNFTEITARGTRDILDEFLSKLSEVKTQYVKSFKPFDTYGARMDFEERVSKWALDMSTAIDKKTVKKIEEMDLDKYGDADRFELIDEDEVIEQKVADSSKINVVTGRNFNFKSKVRGNGITIFVPGKQLIEVEKYFNETYKSSGKKKGDK